MHTQASNTYRENRIPGDLVQMYATAMVIQDLIRRHGQAMTHRHQAQIVAAIRHMARDGL